MNIIAVDDERAALRQLDRAIHKTITGAVVECFLSAQEALSYAKSNAVDVAFLDIEMDEMNGLVLAKQLKDMSGKTNIIFVTGFSSYLRDAFEMHASGYVMKPINPTRVAHELENLRNPVVHSSNGIRVQCFGNFEVYADGEPVIFKRSKSKEAFAYLVDRGGASVTKKELAAVLWEDEPYNHSLQSHLSAVIAEISRSLEAVGATDIIRKTRGSYCVDTAKIQCDYYGFEKGVLADINRYHGEYMTNYSWAEFTAGRLYHKVN